MPAAVVHETRERWARLETGERKDAWLLRPEGAGYHAIEEVLPSRLGYLTAGWDGFLWPSPGAGIPFRASVPESLRREPPIEVLGAERVAESLWLRIRVLAHDPCGEPKGEGDRAQEGFVPAWNASGDLTSWFHSRGC
jgi:hypothetical protein